MKQKTMQVHLIAAARPNFMKIAPLFHVLRRETWAEPLIIHTGQHYDFNMSEAFFDDLNLPPPHFNLETGSGTHAEQTGKVMIAYERLIKTNPPQLTIVVGDVNSTVACTLAACKVGVKVAHLEAGLRSYDRTMPEEINRVVTDALADILWTPSLDADENLRKEGIPAERIVRVGNIMIDCLVMLTPAIEQERTFEQLGLDSNGYGIVTLHRPSNVDNSKTLEQICTVLNRLGKRLPLVFPIHPRTKAKIETYRLSSILQTNSNIHLIEPLGYKQFMNLIFHCKFVITDSGGIQEETTYLGIPCFTLRPNTERPITIIQGTNILSNVEKLEYDISSAIDIGHHPKQAIQFWDGKTAERVVKSIRLNLQSS